MLIFRCALRGLGRHANEFMGRVLWRSAMRKMLAVYLLLAACPALLADVVHLTDGRTIEGKVRDQGDTIAVEFPGGEVSFPRSQVSSIEFKPTLRDAYLEKVKAAGRNDTKALRELAEWCAKNGLGKEEKEAWELVLDADKDDLDARNALGYVLREGEWVTLADAMRREGYVMCDGKWVPEQERQKLDAKKAENEFKDKMEAEARRLISKVSSRDKDIRAGAVEMLCSIEPRFKAGPLASALSNKNVDVRRYAVDQLRAIQDKTTLPKLAETAVKDADFDIRATAVAAIKDMHCNTSAVPLFIGALRSGRVSRRINAARALGEMGDDRAIVYLITELRWVGGGGPRQNAFFGNQMAYVRDYDAEIATDAAVFDPVIGVVNDAAVLDAKVLKIEQTITIIERRVVSKALAKLTGKDFGDDWQAWNRWWQSEDRK
jgi:hypothetical protein